MPLKASIPAASTARRDLSYKDGYVSQDGTVVQFQKDWFHQHPLEGDGLLSGLYNYMWKSDKTKEHRLKTAWIPDTVLYLHNFPRVWYSYDQKAQEIIKRPGKLLDARSIYDFFCDEEGSDIVAQFFWQKSSGTSSSSPRGGSKGASSPGRGGYGSPGRTPRGANNADDDDDEPATDVEFFTADQLYDFLHNRKTKPDGVLQKFVVPKGEASSRSNFQIQAVWSPVVTLVYKRTNKKRLNDHSIPVHERAATFDGPPHYSSESLVADSTRQRVDALCTAIVKHFKDTEHKPITRLVIYFKLDERDRLWVLWSSSIRIARDRVNHSHLRVPLHLSMKFNSSEHGDSSPRGTRQQQKELLDRDIALYELTGDWVFAAKCAGKRENAPKPPGKLAVNRTGGGRPETTTLSSSQQTPRPPNRSQFGNSNASITSNGSNTSPTKDRTGSPGSHNGTLTTVDGTPERTPRAPVFISPRAPFLATVEPHHTVPVESTKHPLHEAYVDLQSQGDNDEDTAHVHRRSMSNVGRTHRQQRTRYIPPKLTDMEKLKEELRVHAEDAVYLAYSSSLEITPTVNPTPVSVELAVPLRAALSPDDLDGLVATMCLVPVDETDGLLFTVPQHALTRGRRHDRPVVQILRDVKYYFDKLFEEHETEISTRWQEHMDSQNVISE